MTSVQALAAVGLLAATALLLTPFWRGAAPAPATERTELDRIVAACVEDMVRQTCRVMGAPGSAKVADGTVVFVAGIGAIEASAYNELRLSGNAMCQTVRKSCLTQWDGPGCKTARTLYSGT